MINTLTQCMQQSPGNKYLLEEVNEILILQNMALCRKRVKGDHKNHDWEQLINNCSIIAFVAVSVNEISHPPQPVVVQPISIHNSRTTLALLQERIPRQRDLGALLLSFVKKKALKADFDTLPALILKIHWQQTFWLISNSSFLGTRKGYNITALSFLAITHICLVFQNLFLHLSLIFNGCGRYIQRCEEN